MLGRESSGRAPLLVLIVCFYVAVLMSLVLVAADPPPKEHGLAGWILGPSGAQAPLGTYYSINDSDSDFFMQNVTRIPFPGQSGRYSEVVSGRKNDIVVVRAWNNTHFGFTTIVLDGDMDDVNVTLNGSRVGEPTVTVILPVDDQLYNIGDNIIIRANFSISADKDALNCNATVTFTSPGVITLQDGETASQFMGNLSRGSVITVNWSANASQAGTTDINITVVCDDNQTGFDTTGHDTAYDQMVAKVPPIPHGIAGWIFDADGSTQMPLGTFYEIRDYSTNFLLENETRIPFPGYTGRYSEVMNGSDNDIVNVTAWNATHWGFTTVTLIGDMDEVNVSLNMSRPSETNVTIIYPLNNTAVSKIQLTNVTARVQVIGGSDGINCSATIYFEDDNILNITPVESYTKPIGNITLWDFTLVSWNVSGEVGLVNVTVNASCDSDGKNFEELHWDIIIANITMPPFFVDSLVCENPINLQEAVAVGVQCNVTIFNGNYAVNISVVNATLYDSDTSSPTEADDNNYHYTNTTCQVVDLGLYEANYTCVFPLLYYANNGTWTINLTMYDNVTLIQNSTTNLTTVNSLFALSADNVMDFGNLAPTDTSATDVNLTLTNTGNMDINISAYGYGEILGDNLSMNCTVGNISVDLVHYHSVFNQAYTSMTGLRNDSVMITNFILPQRTDDSAYDADQNDTYWKIQIPMDTEGFCNGTVIASASAS